MDFPAQAHPHPHGGWPGNELRRCCPPPSACRAPAAGSWRCSAAAWCGYPCRTAAASNSGPLDLPLAGDRGPGLRAGVQLGGAAPAGRRRADGVHHRPRRGVRPRPAPAGRHRREPGRRGRHPAAAAGRWPSCAGPAAPRWTDPRPAAGSASSSRTGRTTRWTSWPRPPPSSPPSASCAPPAAAWPPSRRPTPSCSSASNSPTGRTTPAPSPWTPWSRAPTKAPLKTQVNLVLLEAAQDPVCDWMRANVHPFYNRDL